MIAAIPPRREWGERYMKAIIYTRFSTRPRPEESDSIAYQREHALKYCAFRGWSFGGPSE